MSMESRFCPSCGSPHSGAAPYFSASLSSVRRLMDTKEPHIGHKKHLCVLCETGDCSLAEIKELVKDAKFICNQCGRVAAKEENLCEPVAL